MTPLIAALLLVAAAPVLAVDSRIQGLAIGTHVRLHSDTVAARVEGVVVQADHDAITVSVGERPVRIPVSSLDRVEISLGRRGNTRKGLIAGALLGILVGLGSEVADEARGVRCTLYSDVACSRREAVVTGMAVMGGLGAGVGALVRQERWAALDLGVFEPAPTVLPGSGAVLALRIRF